MIRIEIIQEADTAIIVIFPIPGNDNYSMNFRIGRVGLYDFYTKLRAIFND